MHNPFWLVAATLFTLGGYSSAARAQAILLNENGCSDYRTVGGAWSPFVQLDQRVKARDGTSLSIDIYRPLNVEPVPTILQVTPYGHDALVRASICKALSKHYAIVVAYARGTARSEGVFIPEGANDGPDGVDFIQWIAAQPWSDQRVVMVGGSYQGGNQWTIAAQLPKALVAIAPRAIATQANWFPVMGARTYSWLIGFKDERINEDVHYWREKYLAMQKLGLTLPDQAAYYGADEVQARNVRYWFNPVGYDERREADYIKPEAYAAMARTGLQVLTLAGYFDDFCHNETIEKFLNWQQSVAPEYRRNATLIVGPWTHDLSTSVEEGGLRFAPESKLDLNDLTLAWFEHVLRGAPLPSFLVEPVSYYQMGLDEGWHHVDSISAMSTQTLKFYLAASPGQGGTWFAAGKLSPTPVPHLATATIRDDPRAIGYVQEAQLRQDYDNAAKNLDSINLLSETAKLVYVGPPSAGTVTVSGRPKVTIYGSLDVPDADFYAYLFGIEPDGRSIEIGHAQMRARYSDSRYHAQLVKPEEIRAYHFDFYGQPGEFHFTSRKFASGTRFALVITPPFQLGYPWNYHTGQIVGMEDFRKARIANFKVFQSGKFASFIELPTRGGP